MAIDEGHGAAGTHQHESSQAHLSLTVVIPALNEEEAIGSTVQRCLDASEYICTEGRVRGVEIIVVNDGSTDGTSKIAHGLASTHANVSVVDFEHNRGYGAALKQGFEQGTGELVSFLDADGTCDPEYFAEMCRVLQEESAEIVLGSRMGPNSQMPRVRRLGNRMFATLLGFLSGKAVSDTASGMRVIRRDALSRLYPLPDGLQFTPAMSARAILDDLKIVEVNMDYAERVGESKLHALRDGVRFLAAIFSALLLFRPSRVFNIAAAATFLLAVILVMFPAEYYVRNGRLQEWMLYRILLCLFLSTCSFVLVSSGVVANQLVMLVHGGRTRSFLDDVLHHLLSPGKLMIASGLAACLSIYLVRPGMIEYLATNESTLHWSRAIVAVFLMQVAVGAAATAVLQWVVQLWRLQADYHLHQRRDHERG